ncbi:unnamed protein product [Brugia timori]|uniref:Uncharacterized protein n=1 Tax=Brugia timori TaxID=42155 RepID=A0A0R3QRT8_9BILA|nr:unnamed protein product [Brugia timori]
MQIILWRWVSVMVLLVFICDQYLDLLNFCCQFLYFSSRLSIIVLADSAISFVICKF